MGDGGFAYDSVTYRTQEGGQYEGELGERPAPVVVEAFNKNVASTEGLRAAAEPNASRVRVQAPTPDRTSDLYRVQFELARIDCFDGAIDGRWSLRFHDRLAHVALTQELDLAALASVDQVLAALRSASVGICDAPLASQSARVDVTSRTDEPLPTNSEIPSLSVKRDVLRAHGALDRELPDGIDDVADDVAQAEAVSAYRQLDAFVTRNEVQEAEAEVTPAWTAPEPSPAPYEAPLLIERHAEAYPLEDNDTAVELAADEASGDPEVVVVTDVRVLPTVDVEATETVRADPSVVTPEPTAALPNKVVASVDDVDVVASSDPTPGVVVVAAVSPAPVALPPVSTTASRVAPFMPLPARRALAFARVFGADAEAAELSRDSTVEPRAKRLRRRSRARNRAIAASAKPKAAKAKAAPKSPNTWKSNRSAIFRPRG